MATYGAVLDALGDSTRRHIFELVATRPQAVGELAAQLPVSRPAVSQHLRALKDAGLVRDRAEGTRRIYRVDTRGVAVARRYLDRFWDEALTAFADAVQGQADQQGPPRGPRPHDPSRREGPIR